MFWICFFLFTTSIGGFSQAYCANILVPGSLTHENKVSPKQVLQGSIPIQNEGDKPVFVNVTLTDYLFNAKGESFFPPVGTCTRSNASWIKPGKTNFEIAPHTTYTFNYTIEVPQASLLGSYWSIFLIEPQEEIFEGADKKQSLGVQTVIRYGVQILTHIGQGSYDLKVLNKSLRKEEKSRSFILDVENSGNMAQSPILTLELINSFGKKIGRFESSKQRILPTCSTAYQVDLSSVAPGKYKALAILDHGEGALFGAQYDLTLD